MTAKIRPRGDTAANWATNNPTLALRELGLETDTEQFKIGDGVTAWTSLPYWSNAKVMQVVSLLDTATYSGTSNFPTDDTVPQKTEGWALFEQAITPLEATSKIDVLVVVNCSVSAAEWIIGALWLNDDNDALALNSLYQGTAGGGGILVLRYRYANTDKTVKTFKVRMANWGGSATVYVNNFDGAEKFGNTPTSSMLLTEVKG